MILKREVRFGKLVDRLYTAENKAYGLENVIM